MSEDFIPCHIKQLPYGDRGAAAETAVAINPVNRPAILDIIALTTSDLVREVTVPGYIAAITQKCWQTTGAKLGVSFLDNPPADVRDRILLNMNEWSKYCNVAFAWSQSQGQIRVDRGPTGYWSNLGTDCLHIPGGQPTMNLQGFTMATPESEWVRVVQHETGHALGFPHEHLRPDVVARLDVTKTIRYFMESQHWSSAMVVQQVLTPLNMASVRGTPAADQDSIMCYQLPGSITKDGQPIRGGTKIDALDAEYAGKIYPLVIQPPVNRQTVLRITGENLRVERDGVQLG